MSWTQARAVGWVVLLCVLATPVQAQRGSKGGRLWLEAKSHALRKQRSELSQVARASMRAVVSITTRQESSASSDSTEEPQKGIGSGFIIHPSGFILTSAHVVEGATEITVTLLSPRGYPEDYPARVVGEDERTDFALLKIECNRKLPVLRLSSASHVDIGDWIVVIGNPFGLSHSVTVGVVSFKGRTDVTPNGRDGDFDYMQMDASINPGNSGGPVLDLHGDVVAIANAVNVAGQGIGFAVPVDIAKAVLPHLRAYGKVRRGWLGISVQDFSPEVAQTYGLTPARGVVVSDVIEGSPGARAGLRTGDVIERMDAWRVDRAHMLRWQVSARGAGKSVVLHVRRHSHPLRLRVTLDELPAESPAAAMATRPTPSGRRPAGRSGKERATEAPPAPSEPAPTP
ncbi:trypsin-like peptidase domain-containing protein [Myxococcaceae bacterium GXIMD 01537]